LEQQAKLLRVEAKLKQIESEGCMPNYEAILKTVKPIKVASIRETLPNYSGIARLYNELLEYLKQHKLEEGTYWAAIWHDPEYRESDVDGEAVVLL
jgi:effector-binding domain-containing protein